MVAEVRAGRCPIPEPGLAELVARGVAAGRLTASTDPAAARGARAVLITVGTPLSEDFTADLGHIRAACAGVAPHLHDGQIVMIKSTVPPGTTRAMYEEMIAPAAKVHMAFSPERLAEGAAIRELASIPILVGGIDAAAGEAAAAFWREALPVEVMTVASPEAAEMVKLADNLWIDLNIALANELAKLVDAMPWKIDVMEVIRGANTLKKGQHHVNILHPANGVGGYCLTKDPWFVDALGRRAGIELKIPRASRAVNDSMPGHVFDRVMGALAERGARARRRPRSRSSASPSRATPATAASRRSPRSSRSSAPPAAACGSATPWSPRPRRRTTASRSSPTGAAPSRAPTPSSSSPATTSSPPSRPRTSPPSPRERSSTTGASTIRAGGSPSSRRRASPTWASAARAAGSTRDRGMAKSSEIVMVTGAAGFVGSFLVERLIALGQVVHGLDIAPLAAARNLEAVRDHPNFHYVQGDIRDPEVIRGFFRPEASVLYHLASVVGVRRYMEDPLSLIDIAIIGTRHLIALAVEHEVRILFTSTSEVYGRNPAVPWKEDDDRVLGATSVDRWSYAASKGVCEQMLYGVHRKTGLPFSIVRFFNVYGPRQAPIYVVSQTVQRVLNGRAPGPLRRRRPDPLPHLRRATPSRG